ncbi:lipoprotein [Spiroplasma sp. ald]|uniref:lipoprotein n=1 Tax=Spiroplasma sp. ald TaxID=2490849 RepID=UPI0037DCAE57
MKKILSLLGTITIIGTSITSLVACNIFNKDFNNKIETFKYTEEELKELKEKIK